MTLLLGWSAVIAVGLPAGASLLHIVLLLGGCAVLATGINLGYALIFSSAPLVARYQLARRWIEGTMAALFASAGIGLLAWRP